MTVVNTTTTPSFRLNYSGWCNPWSGYGKANINWLVALDKITGGGASMEWERRKKKNDPGLWKDLTKEQRRVITKRFTKEKIGVIQATPPQFNEISNDFKVGMTMVENTQVCKDWISQCNKMNHLFVPNHQLIPIFKDSGLTIPCTAVREGMNPDQHKFIQRKQGDVFTFLILGWMDDRKNWQDAVRAFTSEFAPHEPVRLLIKNSNPAYGSTVPNDPRIKIIDHNITPEELDLLYGMSDCLLFVTRGEGSGLPPREAMATGLPVILTDWLGTAEISDPRYNYPIKPIALDYPDWRPEQPGFMARFDVAEIMYWMRHVYENWDEAMAKGKLASEWMAKDWTWEACANEMLVQLKEMV